MFNNFNLNPSKSTLESYKSINKNTTKSNVENKAYNKYANSSSKISSPCSVINLITINTTEMPLMTQFMSKSPTNSTNTFFKFILRHTLLID